MFRKDLEAQKLIKLEGAEATRFRGAVARLNYVSAERPDIQYATKELARAMANPTNHDVNKLKRLARYLVGRPRLQIFYPWQSRTQELNIYTDSDYAGDGETRRSTSGGCVCIERHFVRTWSKHQKVMALSSGEAELYAVVTASCEGFGN